MRRTIFRKGEYYHIYNRGVDKRKIFLNKKDYIRFLVNLREFNNDSKYKNRDFILRKDNIQGLGPGYPGPSPNKKAYLFSNLPKLVELICYCLNPNHYHFIIKQLQDKGIEKFMHKIGSGYTTYFNKKHIRSGSLFQGKFKSIHIDTDEYLTWLSGYINVNPKLHGITNDLENYPWSSYLDYINERKGTLCNKNIILELFLHKKHTYKHFIDSCLPEMKQRKDLQKYFIE